MTTNTTTEPSNDGSARRVLFLTEGSIDHQSIEQLRTAGWQVDLAETTAAAEAILSKSEQNRQHYVGIVSCTSPVSLDIKNLEMLLGRHNLYWIATVSPEMRDRTEFRRLLATHFYDFHTHPVNPEALVGTVGHAYGMTQLSPRIERQPLYSDGRQNLIGASKLMLDHFRNLTKAARVNAPVLISGETGTGKQLSALVIHQLSSRNQNRFIPVNCAASSHQILAQNLFGCERANPGGTREIIVGGIEAAANGTLFLSGLENLPKDLQAQLLEFIEAGHFTRVGGSTAINANPRIIASTNTVLEEMIEQGDFREDLYYLLRVINLEMSPLRERMGDIELLADYFFNKFSSERNSRVRGFSHQSLMALHRHGWPGNVRELENRVRQSLVLCEGHLIQPKDLDLDDSAQPSDIVSLEEARIRAEGEYIRNALHRNYHNVTETAQQLGVSRVTLYRLMKKYNIDIVTERQREL